MRRDLLARAAGAPGLADLFGRDDRQGLELREAALTRLFPDVLRVRLLPMGLSVPDTEETPKLSYAPLDLLGRAEQAKTAPPAELHHVGAGDEHIAMAARVLADDQPVGLIHVAYPSTSLRRSLDGVDKALGRIELRQLTGDAPRDRPEKRARLFDAAPDYYEDITCIAMSALGSSVEIVKGDDGISYRVRIPAWERCLSRLTWRLRFIQGKLLSALRLIKAMATFEGGVNYILWKIERHSGVTVDIEPRLRRRPLLAMWVLSWRLYRRGGFR